MAKKNYDDVFAELLGRASVPVDEAEIFARFDVARGTVAKHLRGYLARNPACISRIVGFYPDADTVIALAEKELGSVAGNNVSAINRRCKDIIDGITRPRHRKFLDGFFSGHLEPDGRTVRINRDVLAEFLYDEYAEFVRDADNGLVSIAGTMNEKILIRGLENAGLTKDTDYRKTGKNSEGDVQIEHRGTRVTKILFCEIKSYAARERLLRGLQDITSKEKVGVGFFNQPAEFNPDRTQTLIDAGPLAIYMPDDTMNQLEQDSLEKKTARQDRVYRPLSKFFSDMVEYRNSGSLPSMP